MNSPGIHKRSKRGIAMLPAALILVGGMLCLSACWRSAQPTADAPATATPATPAPPPQARAATPAAPAPMPSPPRPAPKPEPKPVSLAELAARANPLSLDNMKRIQPGMTLEQVNRYLGKDGEMFSSTSVDSEIYRWTDESGASIVAKFENGKLARKSTFLPEGASPGEEEDATGGNLLSQELYNQVKPGMTVEEIQALLNVNRRAVSNYDATVTMYEWVDSKGANFFARFEDGKMTRKTGFHVAPIKDVDRVEEPDSAEEADTESAESPQGEAEPVPSAEAPTEETEMGEEFWAEGEAAQEEGEAAQPARKRVAVVGGARDTEKRSYRPQAKFPDYTWQFRRGDYEVRVQNTADMKVKIGLRSGKYGKDISIAPGRSASIKVNQGDYTLYFQYEDEPYNVYTGQSFNIDGMLVTDIEVQVFNQSYDIGILNRAYD